MLKCQRLSITSKTSKELGTTFGISDFWNRLVDKAFYFILCVGYIASEEARSEVERGEKENWLEKHD